MSQLITNVSEKVAHVDELTMTITEVSCVAVFNILLITSSKKQVKE